MTRLLVLFAPERREEGTSVVLDELPVIIGRGHGVPPLRVADDLMSRRHVAVEPDGDGWRARDLGSHNGTFVDGQRVESVQLVPGAVIRAGATLLLYQELQLAAATPRDPPCGEILGGSLAMQRVRAEVRRATAHQAPVLILGETGVGKEVVARAIHDQSKRPGSLVAVNCAALPEALAESELFGHIAGAFTGASARAPGLFMEANRGTLFLDEIGEMPLALQAKVLRALSTGEVRPIGGAATSRIDVRVVAATNRDLEAEVVAERFRADLYARLQGQVLEVLPLRERKDDVIALARHFLHREVDHDRMDVDAAEALLVYRWPYNVRELENAMRAAAGDARDGRCVALHHLPDWIHNTTAPERREKRELDLVRYRRPSATELGALLERTGGNIAEAARALGVDRRQVYRWLDAYDIKRDGRQAIAGD